MVLCMCVYKIKARPELRLVEKKCYQRDRQIEQTNWLTMRMIAPPSTNRTNMYIYVFV